MKSNSRNLKQQKLLQLLKLRNRLNQSRRKFLSYFRVNIEEVLKKKAAEKANAAKKVSKLSSV